MADKVVWWRLKYPERAYAYVCEYLFGETVADIDPKYYPVVNHAIENVLFADDYFTEREREIYKMYIMENMGITSIAKAIERSPERVRQVMAKTMRKLHASRIMRKIEKQIEIPLKESMEFRDARNNYNNKKVYLDSWPKNQALILKAYLLKKFFPKETFEDGDFVCRITRSGTMSRLVPYDTLIESVEESGMTYEEFFSDISYENCELLNQFFMETPYIKDGSEIRTVPTVPYIDFNEIARNQKTPLYVKPQVIDPTPFSNPKVNVNYAGEVFEPRGVGDDLPAYILNPWLYKCASYPGCIIWYLRDIKIITECDRMVVRYLDKKIADRFYDAVNACISDEAQIKALRALFNDTTTYQYEEEVVTATNTLRKNYEKVRAILLTPTGSEKGKFMAETDNKFRELRRDRVQNILKPAQLTRQINDLCYYKRVTSYSSLVTKVINEEITSLDLNNDPASIRIINRLLAQIRYINYSTGGKIFNISNVVIPHLAIVYEHGSDRSKTAMKRKTEKMDQLDNRSIPMNKHVYNASVTNPRVVEALNKANIKTIGDLIRAVRSDRDLCEIPGITQEDVYGLLIYTAYVNNDCTFIIKK